MPSGLFSEKVQSLLELQMMEMEHSLKSRVTPQSPADCGESDGRNTDSHEEGGGPGPEEEGEDWRD